MWRAEILGAAPACCARLSGIEPHNQRPGYVNFAIDKPPLRLALFENPSASERLNHLGVEVLDPAEVSAAERRFRHVGILGEI